MTFSNAVPAANEKLSVSVLQIAYKLSVSRSCYVQTCQTRRRRSPQIAHFGCVASSGNLTFTSFDMSAVVFLTFRRGFETIFLS